MVILPFYLERNVLCQLIHSVQLTHKKLRNRLISELFLAFCSQKFDHIFEVAF